MLANNSEQEKLGLLGFVTSTAFETGFIELFLQDSSLQGWVLGL